MLSHACDSMCEIHKTFICDSHQQMTPTKVLLNKIHFMSIYVVNLFGLVIFFSLGRTWELYDICRKECYECYYTSGWWIIIYNSMPQAMKYVMSVM